MSSTRRDFLAAAAVVGFTGAARAQHEPVAFALIGDRYHNSDHYRTAFGKTFVRDMGLAMDISDEVKLLKPDHLSRYRVLIILRDGMIWPDGHGNPRSNAGWWAQGQSDIVSDPPLPTMEPRREGSRTSRQSRVGVEVHCNFRLGACRKTLLGNGKKRLAAPVRL